MLSYNEITPKKYIVLEGEPYEVLTSHVFRKQQRKPVNATKLKNLITGGVMEHSFKVSDKVEEAEIETEEVKYIYTSRGKSVFCEKNNPSKRFEIEENIVGSSTRFMKQNIIVELVSFEDRLIGVKLPIKVELKVKEAPPNLKGNTAQGGVKTVTLETGAQLNVPMFINQGDVIRVNTETGQYVERVQAET